SSASRLWFGLTLRLAGTWLTGHQTKVARDLVVGIFEQLASLSEWEPVQFRFEPEAQDYFYQWLEQLETALRSGEEPPELVIHFAKYRKLMPSIALLCQLIEDAWAESGSIQ